MANTLAILGGVLGGFGLSFLSVGMLWIAMPFYVQALAFFPFLLLSLLVGRYSKSFSMAASTVIVGALPMAKMMVGFRDKDDSHLMPILMVSCWMLGALVGAWLGSSKFAKK